MTYRVRNIVIAVVLAVLAGLFVTLYLAKSTDEQKQAQELVTAYVATRDIPVGASGGDVLDHLQATEIARDDLTPGAISSPEDVEKLVTAETIRKGEYVTASQFTTVKQSGVVGEIAGPQRALQLAGDANQLLVGTLKQGDRVDVIATIPYQVDDLTSEGEVATTRERVATRIVLRDIAVLRAPELQDDEGKLTENTGQQRYSVILNVTDEQSEKLFHAVSTDRTKWALELRPAVEAKDSAPSVQTIETILGDGLGVDDLARLLGAQGVNR
jgi:Flp pilus assembly protein CpaB